MDKGTTETLAVKKEQTIQDRPSYSKPQTSLFLAQAELIQGGAGTPLESQGGTGYLTPS